MYPLNLLSRLTPISLILALTALSCAPADELAAPISPAPPGAEVETPPTSPPTEPFDEPETEPRTQTPLPEDPPGRSDPEAPPPPDADGDLIADSDDNCPNQENEDQCDSDLDGLGDVCDPPSGTSENPFVIQGCVPTPLFSHLGDTCEALQSSIDSYPPASQAQAGPEVVYIMHLTQATHIDAQIVAPEPSGTDVDVHLLRSLDPLELVERDHYRVTATVEAGTYYLVLDTFGADDSNCGPYDLKVQLTPLQAGTLEEPITPAGELATPVSLPYWYEDTRDTHDATSDVFDVYPTSTANVSGPEYIYAFTVDREVRFAATIQTPEPAGVDVDIHLLGAPEAAALIDRDNRAVYAILPAGTYYLVLDTWADANDTPWTGAYTIRVSIRERGLTEAHMMNSYVLAAVDYLYAEYGLLGYGAAALTHDIPYGEYGSVPKSGGALTMCVAAAMEVILQAMILYAEDTGDTAVFDFLPLQSWKSLAPQNIRAHIWVNHEIGTWGTADALVNFGMGITLPFEELRPGAFINLNRTNGTGHAVVLISFIDKHGREYDTWNDRVIGFKYFSSQGGSAIDTGGLDYRYAIFSEHGKLTMPYKRDTGVIYSTNPHYLNTGELLGPWHWGDTDVESWVGGAPSSAFDPAYFNGWTIDDVPSL